MNKEELQVDTKNWHLAVGWAKWWSQLKVGKMFQKSLKDMTDADYSICPPDSNAVESHNKKSNSHTSNLVATLEHYLVVDKNSAYDHLAASQGPATGMLAEKRITKNIQRRKRRYGVKMVKNAGDHSVWDAKEKTSTKYLKVNLNTKIPNTVLVAPAIRKSKRQIEQQKAAAEKAETYSTSIASRGSTVALLGLEEDTDCPPSTEPASTAVIQDKHIGMNVWIYTVENGKNYGRCEAVVIGKRQTW